MKELTEKQKNVLLFIRKYTEENTCPPTVRETAEYFGVSLKAIQDHIVALRKKGYLSESNNKSRSLKILVDDEDLGYSSVNFQNIPILGTVAAGRPIFCDENFTGYFPMPEPLVRSGRKYFALRVRGTSMINAGILDGDIAIIQQSETARNGEIVVAIIEDSVTLKRFYKEEKRIRSQPENNEFNPIYTTDAKILGTLTNIIRSY